MRLLALLPLGFVAVACPSLDGFSGKTPSEGGTGVSGGFLSLTDAARVCSKVKTCFKLGYSIGFSLLIPMDAKTYSTCVDVLASPLPPGRFGLAQQVATLKCVAEAADCSAAGLCLPYESISSTDPRCQGEAGTVKACSPDNAAIYNCSTAFITHCDHEHFAGGSCMASSSGDAECAAAPTCTQSASFCTGDVVEICMPSGFAFKVDCRFWGQTCGKDQGGGPNDCVLNGITPQCANDDVVCVADRVRACYGGYYGEIDCLAGGAKCDAWPTAHCARPDDACTQTDLGINTCNGDAIELCVAGKRMSFDCASIGLACVPNVNSAYCG